LLVISEEREWYHDTSSELGNVDLTVVDQSGDLLGALAIDGAAEGDASAEDLLDSASGIDGHALGAKLLGDVDNVVELEVAVVLHVLLLLSVTRTLLECLDDEGGGGGQNSDEALSVLDHHFDLNLNSAPLSGSLLDVFTDLLGGHTEGTALGGESGSGGNFTTDDLHVH
jgi:hypothetical protein